jgi:hypothetical protein
VEELPTDPSPVIESWFERLARILREVWPGSWYAGCMPYVVKAVSTSGIISWLTPPGAEGCRSIAPRSRADVLSTVEDAKAAIAKMPWVFPNAGIRFSVVETEEPHEASLAPEHEAAERSQRSRAQ